MKKWISMFLMILFLLAVSLLGEMDARLLTRQTAAATTENHKKENPIPPDFENLRELGIDETEFQLPVLMFDTGRQQLKKESKTWVTASVFDDESGIQDIGGKADAVLTATLNYRGASSYLVFDKPQYRLEFYRSKNGKPLDVDLFGLGAGSEWVLNGPFLDRSLLRNYLMYHLAENIMDWAPASTFCEVFVDGAYQGVYLAVEPVTNGADRLRLSKFGLLSGATAYIVGRDRVGTEGQVLDTYGGRMGYTGQALSIHYPGARNLTDRQYRWIAQNISEFEEALYSDFFTDPQIGYASHMDTGSFVDYFILNEFAMNHDAGVLSTYAYQELGGRLKLCVWDYNNCFDNYQWFRTPTDAFYLGENYWFDRLLEDRGFVDQVVARYRELRSGALSDEAIQTILDTGRETLGPAVDRNFALWGYTLGGNLLSDLGGDQRDPASYEEAVAGLETVIRSRLAFLDGNIERLYDACRNEGKET